MTYTLAQFKEIEAAGFDYAIPPEIVDSIRAIASIVGAVSYSPTPVFPKPISKQGGEKSLGEVVGLLNKLTADSYDKIAVKIVGVIGHLDPSDTDKLCEAVFRIASGNRFYSKIYANLCKELCQYPAFKQILDTTCEGYAAGVHAITADGRALTLFLTNLAVNHTISMAIAVQAAQQLQQLVEDSVDSADKKEQIDEWTEHLALMLTVHKPFKAACGLDARLAQLSKLKPKEHAGLSVKTIFRYLDMIEHFN
jgi:hypothetical protein